MTKEYYEKHKAERQAYQRKYNSEHREERLDYNRHYQGMYAYVKDGDITLIENYELAKADNFEGWCVHHRYELGGEHSVSRKHLIQADLYYNRPAEELIFLTISEHSRLHRVKEVADVL